MASKVPNSGTPTVTAVAADLLTEAAEVIDTSTYFGSATEYSDFQLTEYAGELTLFILF